MIKFYDTNALLELQEEAFKEFFLCADVTLRELEEIKTSSRKSEDVKYKARKLSHLLDEHTGEYYVCSGSNSFKQTYKNNPDMEIIKLADMCNGLYSQGYDFSGKHIGEKQDIIFVSNDICCKNLARVEGLEVESTIRTKSNIYKGYKEITGDTHYINDYMNNIDYSDWNINEYLLINNTDDDSHKEMRFDGEKFVALKLPPSKYIKAKNALQRCALDMLFNPDITVCAILGGYGSGKTFLAMRMSLYHVCEKGNQGKILGVREVVGEGAEIGYLPGEKESKIGDFFTPMVQQLDGGEFELESLRTRGVLEQNIPYFMKGTTYNDTIIVVDEAEDLNEKQIRLIGTRLGKNSRIFISGDYKQSVIKNNEQNALVKLCNELKGNPLFAAIYLDEDVRSETSKLFAHIFEE